MIDGTTLPPTDQVYTWVADDGTNWHIHAERLRLWCKAKPSLKVHLAPVDHQLARSFISDNIASMERVVELALRDDKLDPIIFCKRGTFTNGRPDVMLVDGHHRYVLASVMRSAVIPCYMIGTKQWEPFRIVNIPDYTRDELNAIPILHRSY